MARSDPQFNFRISAPLLAHLKERAEFYDRSVTAEIHYLIKRGLDADAAGNTYTAAQVAEIIDALEARRGRPVETLAALKGLLAAYGDDAVFDEDSDRHVEAASRLSDAALQAFKVIAKAEAA